VPKKRVKRGGEGYSGKRARLLTGEPLSEFWQPVPERRLPNAKECCDEGRGGGAHGQGVYLASRRPFTGSGLGTVSEVRQLFDIYQADYGRGCVHRADAVHPAPITPWAGCGWTTPDVDHPDCSWVVRQTSPTTAPPARRQRALQGLADGYFILPYTVPDYLASTALDPVDVSHARSPPPRRGQGADRGAGSTHRPPTMGGVPVLT